MLAFPALILLLAIISFLGRAPATSSWPSPSCRSRRSPASCGPTRSCTRSGSSCWRPAASGAKNRRDPVPGGPAQLVPAMLAVRPHRPGRADRRRGRAWPSSARACRRRSRRGASSSTTAARTSTTAWWISLLPAAMMFLTILAFNLIGDVLAKRFDVRESRGCEHRQARSGLQPPRTIGARCSRSPTSRRTSVTAARHGARRRRREPHRSSGARPSASWASPARARRSCRARSWACSRSATSIARGHRAVRGHRAHRPCRAGRRRRIWGREMAMIFQDPMTSLNPVMKIGNQITESLQHPPRHVEGDADATRRAAPATTSASPSPTAASSEYPHQLSGGMRQRVTIAIALACGPTLLFADEPTTALDVTVQAQILDLLGEQQRDRNMSMILVTHDLGVVAGRTDEIAVMYAGKIVEQAPTRDAVRQHEDAVHRGAAEEHPEAREPEPHPARDHRRPPARPRQPAAGLPVRAALPVRPATSAAPRSRRWSRPRRRATSTPAGTRSARPSTTRPADRRRRQAETATSVDGGRADGRHGQGPPPRPTATPLLRVEDLVVEFPVGRTGLEVNAVSGISLDVLPGETLGLVGESGCGKSHHRAGHHAAAPADRRAASCSRARTSRRSSTRRCASCAPTCR